MNANAYPLQWPDGWKREPSPTRSRFDCTLAQAVNNIVYELERMHVSSSTIVVSTNVELRRDGLPHSGRREPFDKGAAVYWANPVWDDHGVHRGTEQKVIACDRWDRVKDNLRAIEKTLEALRGIDRWGTSDIVKKAFTGFTALPAPLEGWRAVLGDHSTIEAALVRWKELAFDAHPDRGGSDLAMRELNAARADAERELS